LKSSDEGGFLGNILRGIGELVELVQKIDAEGKTEISRTGTFRSFPEHRDAVGRYGFTLKIGLPGERKTGGIGHGVAERGSPLKEREPVIDVFDEGHFIRVVAELPAVSDDEVDIYVKESILYLTVRAKDDSFSKSIVLPKRVKPGTMRRSLRNGILEVLVDVLQE